MIQHKPNDTNYRAPTSPIAIVCIDGCAPEYIEKAIESGRAPTFQRFREGGFSATVDSIIPSYTNPNNIAIVTGTFPEVNGIPGNWFYNRRQQRDEDMNSPDYLRCQTLLKTLSGAGIKVGAITTKDKLRLLLSKGWDGIQISSELAHAFTGGTIERGKIERVISETLDQKNAPIPKITDKWMYSGEPSHYALDMAIAIMEEKGPYVPQVLYVTLTDYIPHRTQPGNDKAPDGVPISANQFIEGIDTQIKKIRWIRLHYRNHSRPRYE